MRRLFSRVRTFNEGSAWLIALLAAALAGPNAGAQVPPSIQRPALSLEDVGFEPQVLAIEGATVFDVQALFGYATALHKSTGHPLTAQSVADAMALMYREDGYPLAEVTWQVDSAAAKVSWLINEGHIDEVIITGLDEVTSARTLRYLTQLKVKRPLQQTDLERALALADDLAGTSLSSRLVPSIGGRGSVLQVMGEQFRRVGGVALDVVPVRPGYAWRLHGHETRYGLLLPGDVTRLNATITREPNSGASLLGSVSYRAPVGDAGDYMEVLAGNARSERGLSNTLERSELRGRHASLAWGRPYQRDLHSYSYWITALEHADATARQGETRPHSQATALRLYWVHGNTSAEQHLAQYGVTLSAGQRPGDPGNNDPDGVRRFGHVRGGLGWSGPWRLGDAVMTYRLEAAAQWTSQPLPRVERFVLGHFPYLRGYGASEVDGDRGAGFTAELVRQGDARSGLSPVRPFVFVSAGRVASVQRVATPSVAWSLASLGLGLRAQLDRHVAVETWVATPLRDGPQSRKGHPALFLSVNMPM